MIHRFLRTATVGGFSALLFVSIPVPTFAAEQVEVAEELERLAKAHGFAVSGLDKTAETPGRAEGEELFPRLRRLLENFDHVIVQDPSGSVDRVIVLGEKMPFEPPAPNLPAATGTGENGDIVIETERRGTQHLVQVSLGGNGGSKIERELQVDTGADYLVLPLSLVPKLGVNKRALEEREMQTANGKVKARIGILPSLWLGDSRITDVETAFLEDDKLGSNGLLGMSVLRRYKLTIDDDKNSITFSGKDGGDTANGNGDSLLPEE